MTATLPLPIDIPAFTAFQDRRSPYERVAVCPDWIGLDSFTTQQSSPPRSISSTALQSTTDSWRDLLISRMLRFARKAKASIREDLLTKRTHYVGIAAPHIEQAAFLVAGALGVLQPNSVITTLTYDQSLHARAELPFGFGSVHVSVLFTSGLDPVQHTGGLEEEDNTLISVFDSTGALVTSAEGPLLVTLKKLVALTFLLRLPAVPAA